MFVEDLIAVGKNITAETSEEHAVHFKEMCKLFAFINPHDHDESVDEYLLKLSLERSANANEINGSSALALPDRSVNRNFVQVAGCSSQNLQRSDPRIRAIESSIPRVPSPMKSRGSFELDIFTIVVQFIHHLDPGMKLFPFGSTQYGIKYPNVNYNLLVTTGEFFVHEM